MSKNKNNQWNKSRGLIGKVILIVIALIILSLVGLDLTKIIDFPYIISFLGELWDKIYAIIKDILIPKAKDIIEALKPFIEKIL